MIIRAAILACAFTLIVAAQRAHACSCIEPSPADARDESEIVVEGLILSSQPVERAANAAFSFIKHRVKVSQVWKGYPDTIIDVFTIGSSSCAYEMGVGKSYLLYLASPSHSITQILLEPDYWPEIGLELVRSPSASLNALTNADLHTGMCSRTNLLSEAGEDLVYLGASHKVGLISTSKIRTGTLVLIGSLLLLARWKLAREGRDKL